MWVGEWGENKGEEEDKGEKRGEGKEKRLTSNSIPESSGLFEHPRLP